MCDAFIAAVLKLGGISLLLSRRFVLFKSRARLRLFSNSLITFHLCALNFRISELEGFLEMTGLPPSYYCLRRRSDFPRATVSEPDPGLLTSPVLSSLLR